MSEKIARIPRTISVLTLAMINVAAVGNVKNWSFIATYGFSSIFYFLLAALIFLIPVSLIAAELATGWPEKGGVFVWVKEAFGEKLGFLAIWLLWIENVVWYPTVLSFIAAALAYCFNPVLAENKFYAISSILLLFWGATFANFFGMRTSGWISTFGAIFGVFLPGIIIIGLGLSWLFGGQPLQIGFQASQFWPDFSNIDNLSFFTGVILALSGLEMSGIHARDVRSPRKDYPRAILLSVLLILVVSALGVLSIAMVVPSKEISLVAGSLQAISIFLQKYNLGSLLTLFAAMLALGSLGSVSTWIVGPTKGLLAAAEVGDLPAIFRKTNRQGVPIPILLTQGLIVTVLAALFLFVPTVSAGFWILTVLAAQLYLLMYILMFAAAIRLRYKKPEVARAYQVPGGMSGMWLVGGIGIIGAIFSFIIGFFPPSQITGNISFYTFFLVLGVLLGCLAPFIILRWQKSKKPPRS